VALFVEAVIQVLIPFYLLVSLWLAGSNRQLLGVRLLCVLAWAFLIRHATFWLVLPYTLCYFYILLALLLAVWRLTFARTNTAPGTGKRKTRQVAISGLLLAWLLALDGWMLLARDVDANLVVDIRFPFDSGNYYVANGGALAALNSHHLTLGPEPRFSDLRGQSFGVDIVAIDKYGMISRDLLLENLGGYQIFGRPVVAPCTGKVAAVENQLNDQKVGILDREHMSGNFVLINCGAFEVLLAHLQAGSVEVAPGQLIESGMAIGRVGNTGNTEMPHLHIHAQRRGAETALLAGEPLELRFDGRYLIKGDIVRL
jgi:hypothetical protein